MSRGSTATTCSIVNSFHPPIATFVAGGEKTEIERFRRAQGQVDCLLVAAAISRTQCQTQSVEIDLHQSCVQQRHGAFFDTAKNGLGPCHESFDTRNQTD